MLTTAANEVAAKRMADHLGLFDEVIASTATHNLKGQAKAEALVGALAPVASFTRVTPGRPAGLAPGRRRRAGQRAPPGIAAKARARPRWNMTIEDRPPRAATLLRAMRPHQWVKNLLVFVPIFTADAMGNRHSWAGGILAFMAFCAVASSIYLVNDLLDLAADRAHRHKRHRPFASGTASLPAGIALSMLLLLAGAALAFEAGILAGGAGLRGDLGRLFAVAQTAAAGRRVRAGRAVHRAADRRR